jgi:hypothetical protein
LGYRFLLARGEGFFDFGSDALVGLRVGLFGDRCRGVPEKASIEISPEMNIIAPASEVSRSPA